MFCLHKANVCRSTNKGVHLAAPCHAPLPSTSCFHYSQTTFIKCCSSPPLYKQASLVMFFWDLSQNAEKAHNFFLIIFTAALSSIDATGFNIALCHCDLNPQVKHGNCSSLEPVVTCVDECVHSALLDRKHIDLSIYQSAGTVLSCCRSIMK